MFGNRHLLRAEERDEEHNQYSLLQRAGIRHPRQFGSPAEIDCLVMVKAPHAKVSFERAFFLVSSRAEYREASARLIREGMLTEEGLANAVIEEYALGPSVNLNFFYSPVLGELELSGTDTSAAKRISKVSGTCRPQHSIRCATSRCDWKRPDTLPRR